MITMETETKSILLGITGSIAAYKMADVASSLAKKGYNVETIITKNGAKIINPIVFSTLTGNKCIEKTFDKHVDYNVAHISLAKKTDLLLIAPATANIIAKIAHGIADDMLTTTILACDCPKLIAPAMNTHMYNNPVVQDNLNILRKYGWIIIEPDEGILACKETGKGKLVKPEELVNKVVETLKYQKDLVGLNFLISAGPTLEAIDPVRFISNHSSGKMGYNLAKVAAARGANVTLVTGKTNLEKPDNVNLINVTSAKDMFHAIKEIADDQDVIIKAAAVADFTPEQEAIQKIKKNGQKQTELRLKSTEDILAYLGEHKRKGQILCGFSMETEDLINNSKKKLLKKNADLICANSLVEDGAGFENDTNIITIIEKDEIKSLDKMSKEDTANAIIDEIISIKTS